MDTFDPGSWLMLSVAVGVFLLPGWIGATRLRVTPRFSAAIIISVLSLFWSVLFVLSMGLEITFLNVLILEVLLSVLFLIGMHRQMGGWREALAAFRPRGSLEMSGLPPDMRLPFVFGGLILVVFFVRLWVDPLSGFDTSVRWNLLAEQMLKLKTLHFYPPISAEDFRVYTYPDSIAPLISTVYWWLYAAVGGVFERLSGLFVIAQLLVILSLISRIATRMAGRSAGLCALVVFGTAPVAFSAIFIGQETGLTTIALLGLIYFLDPDQEGPPEFSQLLIAGCALALGALAREYGWAFLLLGWLILIRRKAGFRSVLLLTGFVFLMAFPWYFRTWVTTGNPLFPMRFGNLFPFNPFYAFRLADNARQWGVAHYSFGQWWALALGLVSQAPLQILALFFIFGKKLRALMPSALLVLLLWLYSIGLTLGGASYSMRVLAPAVAVLSIALAVGVVRFRRAGMRHVMALLVVCLLLRALSWDLNAPGKPQFSEPGTWLGHPFTQPEPGYRRGELPQYLGSLLPRGARLLTYDPYAHAVLMGSPNPAIIVWSPEVSFLFDQRLSAEEMRYRLVKMGVRAVQYRPEGRHDRVLEISPFFRDDRKYWVPLLELDPDSVLYGLPD